MNTKNKSAVIETPAVVQENNTQRKTMTNEFVDVMTTFQNQVKAAKIQKLDSLEAPEAVFTALNPTGLGGAKFFIYEGIKVFPIGKTEEIEEEMNTSLYDKIHGKSGAFIEGR